MVWLAVAIGGALGSMARHGVNKLFSHVLKHAVPSATGAVILIGSATIGLQAALLATGRLHMSNELRTFVFVGILGGFTTSPASCPIRLRWATAANMHRPSGTSPYRRPADPWRCGPATALVCRLGEP